MKETSELALKCSIAAPFSREDSYNYNMLEAHPTNFTLMKLCSTSLSVGQHVQQGSVRVLYIIFTLGVLYVAVRAEW